MNSGRGQRQTRGRESNRRLKVLVGGAAMDVFLAPVAAKRRGGGTRRGTVAPGLNVETGGAIIYSSSGSRRSGIVETRRGSLAQRAQLNEA